jgi:hypothetical protein
MNMGIRNVVGIVKVASFMSGKVLRFSKLIFIFLPVLLVVGLVIERSPVISAETHTSHDSLPETVLDYHVEPILPSVLQPGPLLNFAQAGSVGQWSSVQPWPMVAIHAAMLQDGRIIMWDRENAGTTSMRIYDPFNNTFTKIADPGGASVFCAGFVVLPDNRVLLNGGHLITGDNYGLTSTNIYNPATNTWSTSGNMAQARWYPTTLMLADGRLLTMGGSITPITTATIPEIYNVSSGVWTQMGNASTNPSTIGLYPKLHLLPSGKVFWINAGHGSKVFDPNSGTWSDLGGGSNPLYTSVQYLPGKILGAGYGNYTNTIDLNPNPPVYWNVRQPMAYARYNLNLTILADGKVLATGGSNNNSNLDASAVLPAELWDPATNTWTLLPSMATPRMYHSMAMLLPDGRVVVAGGGRSGSLTNYLNAEFYSPPYLFKGARPTITYAPSQAPNGANITVLTPDANSITKAALIPNPNVTHAVNFNSRYIPLTFTKNDSGRLTVQIPSNGNLVTPGFYMLFLLNSNGVPAVAPIIKIMPGISVSPPPPSGTPTATPVTPSPTPVTPTTPPPTTPPPTTPPPTFTPTPDAGAFPSKGILDAFNRANGGVGTNWGGSTGSYSISGNQLLAGGGDAFMFWTTPFGATQEAYVTLKSINASASEIDLLLKSQNGSMWNGGVMEVWYEPSTHLVRVVTFSSAQGWVQRGPDIPVTFNVGDRFGAKARADGFVEVYRNTTLLATVDAHLWTYANSGGYIGMWVANGQNTQLDDFGGG